MQNLTGIKKNPFPIHRDPDEISDEEIEAPDGQPTTTRMPIEWPEDVNSIVNHAVIQRAALLVYREQTVRTLFLIFLSFLECVNQSRIKPPAQSVLFYHLRNKT